MRPLLVVIRTKIDGRRRKSDPRTHHEIGMHEHEPAVCAVLGGAGLGRHVSADAVGVADAYARAVVRHTPQHVHDRIGNRRRYGAAVFAAKARDDVAVVVLDARQEGRLAVVAVIRQRAVGADHLQERDGTRAEPDRGHGIQFAADTHPPGVVGDRPRADSLDHLRSDGILRVCQGVLQRDHLTGCRTDVSRRPAPPRVRIDVRHDLVANERHLGKAVCERRRIDERLESRSRLPLRHCNVVELNLAEVPSADPGHHVAVLRIHGGEARLHAPKLAFERIDEGWICAERIDHRRAVRGAGDHAAIAVRLPDHLINALRIPIPIAVDADGPIRHPLKVVAHRVDSGLCRLLDARVDRRIDAEALRVKVDLVAVRPIIQPLPEVLGEVRRRTVGAVQPLEVQIRWYVAHLLEFLGIEKAVLDHLLEHDIAALVRALRMPHGIVVDRAL